MVSTNRFVFLNAWVPLDDDGENIDPAATMVTQTEVLAPTARPPAPSRTGSLASSTAAYEATPATTSTSPGTANQTNSAQQLDRFRSWDV